MRLVHKKAVYAKLFKRHHIVLALRVLKFLQFRFQRAQGALQLLDAETLVAAVPQFFQSLPDFPYLLPQETPLPLIGNGNPLKLRMPHNDGVIIAGCDSGAEFLPVLFLKVLFGRYENVRGGIKPQELSRPLFNQVVGNGEQGFLAKPQTLAFHRGGDHLKSFARANLVRKERVAPVKNVRNGV